jgi:hypothetical protein
VLRAVNAAATLKRLPTSISPSELVLASKGDWSLWAVPGCTPSYQATSVTDLAPCTFGAAKFTHTMVVIGDSNAAMWARAFDAIGNRIRWRVLVLSKDNCGPAALHYYQYQLKAEFKACDAWQTWRLGVIRRIKPSVVVMAGWIGGNLGPGVPLTDATWTAGLLKTFHELPAGTKLVTLANQPHLLTNPDTCVASHPTNLIACDEHASDVVTPHNLAFKAAAVAAHGVYVDPTPWFCDAVCPPVIAGRLAYSGIYHINNVYGEYVSGALQAAMKPVITGG